MKKEMDTKTEMTEEEYIEKLKEFEDHYSKMLRIRQEIMEGGFSEPIGVTLFPKPHVQLSQFGKLPQDVSTGLLFDKDHFILEIKGTPYFSPTDRKGSLSDEDY